MRSVRLSPRQRRHIMAGGSSVKEAAKDAGVSDRGAGGFSNNTRAYAPGDCAESPLRGLRNPGNTVPTLPVECDPALSCTGGSSLGPEGSLICGRGGAAASSKAARQADSRPHAYHEGTLQPLAGHHSRVRASSLCHASTVGASQGRQCAVLYPVKRISVL